MPTLQDIANASGVSISTVSKALNGGSGLSSSTRDRILQIAESLNYFSFSRKSPKPTKLVGILVPEMLSNYFATFVAHLESELRELEYLPILQVTNFDPALIREEYDLFVQKKADGIFYLCPTNDDILPYIHYANTNNGIPTVCAAGLRVPNCNNVTVDEESGLSLAIEHLLERGYKNIGFLSDTQNKLLRFPFFEAAMKQHDLECDLAFCAFSEQRFEKGGYDSMQKLLDSGHLPDAIICGYDDIAIGAMRKLAEANLRIPEDIALIGKDNIREAQYLYPSLTTITSPIERMASASIQIFLDAVKHPREEVYHDITFKSELIVREST